ncbi:MAG: hypothetical protein CM15mV48_040 [uncultured marine virus]|nr:MAG: hypothetical protein CM15mV48_040 [uncultured marine virus]
MTNLNPYTAAQKRKEKKMAVYSGSKNLQTLATMTIDLNKKLDYEKVYNKGGAVMKKKKLK